MWSIKDLKLHASFQDSLKLFLGFLRIFGVFLDYGKSRSLKYLAIAYSLLCLGVTLFCVWYNLVHIILVPSTDRTTQMVSYLIDNVSYSITVSFTLLFLLGKSSRIAGIHKSLDQVRSAADFSRKLRYAGYMAICATLILIEVNYIFSLANCSASCWSSVQIIYFNSYVYSISAFFLFCLSAMALARHFDSLAADILKIPQDLYRIDYSVHNRLVQLQKRHSDLSKLKSDISECYGPFLLVGICDLFCRLVSNVYYFVGEDSEYRIADVSWTAFTILETFVRMCFICYVADNLNDKQMSSVMDSLCEIQFQDEFQDAANTIHLFVLQVIGNRQDISAMGIFSVSRKIIVAMTSTTITYVIILYQFQ